MSFILSSTSLPSSFTSSTWTQNCQNFAWHFIFFACGRASNSAHSLHFFVFLSFFTSYCFSLLLFVLFALSTNFKRLFAFVVLWRHLLLVRQTSEISLLPAVLSFSFSLRRRFICFVVFSCFCALLLLLLFSQLILSKTRKSLARGKRTINKVPHWSAQVPLGSSNGFHFSPTNFHLHCSNNE